MDLTHIPQRSDHFTKAPDSWGHLLHRIQKNLIYASGAATDKNWASVLHKDSFSFSLAHTLFSLAFRQNKKALETVYKIGKRSSSHN
jgi:hypothetical protein